MPLTEEQLKARLAAMREIAAGPPISNEEVDSRLNAANDHDSENYGPPSRPWTDEECQQLRKLVDDLGLAEVVFGLANLVATDHPDFETGKVIREDIRKSAKLIQATWKAS